MMKTTGDDDDDDAGVRNPMAARLRCVAASLSDQDRGVALMVTGGIHREAMHAPAGGLDVALAEAFLQGETHQPTFIIDALR